MNLPVLAPLLSLVVMTSADAQTNGFEVSGYIHLVFQYQGTTRTNTRTFSVAVTENNAFIHAGAGTGDRGIDYTEFGSVGTNGFHMDKYLSGATARVSNDSTMSIHPSRVPGWFAAKFSPIWIAYCSHLELRERIDSFLPLLGAPVFVGARPPLELDVLVGMKIRTDWQLDEQPPHLVRSFTDYRDATWDSDRFSPSLIPDEYSTGKTNSTLRILTWTNVGGLHIPLEFQLFKFVVDTNAAVLGTLRVAQTYRVLATNITAGTARKSFLPRLAKATHVVDYRFPRGSRRAAYYLSTNGVVAMNEEDAWLADEEYNDASRRSSEEKRAIKR